MEIVRRVEREFITGDEHAVLHLEGRSGAVVVEARQTDRIHVEAELHVWSVSSEDADDATRAVEAGMEQDGQQRVIVRAPALPDTRGGWSLLKLGQTGSRIDYKVRVPIATSVRVLSRSGRIEVMGVHGRVHCEVTSGRCAVREVQGPVTLVGRSGTVEAELIDGDLTAEARSGRLRVSDVTGKVELESRSGTVEVARVGADLRIGARSGSVSIDDAAAGVYVRARCGPVRLRGAIAADVDIEVMTGPITLAVDPDRPFFVDAESRIGPVTSDLPPKRGGAGPSPDGPKVRLRTHTGPIRLTRA